MTEEAFAEPTLLDPIVVTAPPEAENSSSASVIRDDGHWGTCWRFACYLSKYVYKEPPPPDGFKTNFPEKMAEVERYWEKWDELIEQSDTGLVARLFKVKGYDPSSVTDICPPTLVYRGTDFEDMRDLALVWRVTIFGGTWGQEGLSQSLVIDKELQKNAPPGGYTREDLIARGFTEIPIFDEAGWVWVEGATRGMSAPFRINATVSIMGRASGDWLNNIQQGLGRGSSQYTNSIAYGRRIAEEKILPAEDKRLELTGHSLGGGLASAVCAVLDNEMRDIHFHAITFNPAGVHDNTIRPASASDGSIDAFAVNDEILTTLQSFRTKIPGIGAIFNLARRTINQDGMPPALGTLVVKEGYSPGPSGDDGWSVPGKGEKLPRLFTIDNQTLVSQRQFPIISRLDSILNNSADVSQVGQNIERHLNETYRDQQDGTFVWDIYQRMAARFVEDVNAEFDVIAPVLLATVSYHGMDYVIATYEKHFG